MRHDTIYLSMYIYEQETLKSENTQFFAYRSTLREHLPSGGAKPSSLNRTGFEFVISTFTMRTTRQPCDCTESFLSLSST